MFFSSHRQEIRSYSQPGALEQLMAVDASYLALLGVLNFLFPYILIPVAFNPTQVKHNINLNTANE